MDLDLVRGDPKPYPMFPGSTIMKDVRLILGRGPHYRVVFEESF